MVSSSFQSHSLLIRKKTQVCLNVHGRSFFDSQCEDAEGGEADVIITVGEF